jgi:hypothetical protein
VVNTPNPSFKIAVENRVELILSDYVAQGGIWSDPVNYIQSFERLVPEFDINEDVPICVIIASTANQVPRPSGEMGTARELWTWFVDIYYLDVQVDWDTGYIKMDNIVSRMRNALENEPRLRNLSVLVNPTAPYGGYNEQVYNNDWVSVNWDNSGQWCRRIVTNGD